MKRNNVWNVEGATSSPQKNQLDEINKAGSSKRQCNRKSVIDYLKDYTSRTSLHGIQYFGEENRAICERLWWIIMVGTSFFTCGFLILKVWIKWTESPVIVSFSETPLPIWRIPFPAVTICPTVQVMRTKYNFTKHYEMGSFLKESQQPLFNIASLLCENPIKNGINFFNETGVEDMIKLTPTIRESFTSCTWNELRIKCEDFFAPILTNYGQCFTTNLLPSTDIYREGVVNIKYGRNDMKNDGWALDTGYKEKVPINTFPARALRTGIKNSLSVVFRKMLIDDDHRCNSYQDGCMVSLHPPNVIPRPADFFFWAPASMTTVAIIKPQMITTSPGLKNHPPSRRKCFLEGEKHLRFFNEYTQENCELECVTNWTLAMCKCVTFAMPRFPGTPICGPNKIACTKNANERMFLQEIEAVLVDEYNETDYNTQNNRENIEDCNCLSSCSSITYDSEVTQNKYDWKPHTDAILRSSIWFRHLNFSGAAYGKLFLYFKDPYIITSKRSELYGITDFLSNCGGLLGVCLGFSMLSLAEIIYFITLRLYFYLKERTNGIRASEKINNDIK